VIATNMNALSKVVVSRTLDKAEWGTWDNASVLKGDLAEGITRLKQQPGKDIIIYGSGSLVSDLTTLGLIDEYHMVVNPIVLGCGKSMFESLTTPVRLTLTHTQTFMNGGIVLFYARDAQPS
jgi:dihydrofolate reductase